ncbi:MAG: pyridoxamine 5'-phosphate oxidase family protein [Sneathiellaceae bacterium]
MIPEKFVAFLRGPYGMALASRDASLSPLCTLVFGIVVEPESDTLTMFVPNVLAGATFDNLAATGRAALQAGHGEMHETYQFKGAYLGHRPTTPPEQALQKVQQNRVVAHFRGELGERSPKFWLSFPVAPSTAVAMRIEEIFDQTPGPAAGRRLGL